MTVIDTSGVVDLLLGSGVARAVQKLIERETELTAPDVIVFEVLAVLRRSAHRTLIPAERAAAAVDDLADVPLVIFPSLPLRRRAWALRHNLTAADGLFVALAEALDEPLATKDEPLSETVARLSRVQVVRLG